MFYPTYPINPISYPLFVSAAVMTVCVLLNFLKTDMMRNPYFPLWEKIIFVIRDDVPLSG